MKGAKRYLQIILIIFAKKKILFGENESFWTGQMVHFGLKIYVSL